MVESAREVWLREGGRKVPKECGVKWKEMLEACDEEAKERCMESYREEKRKVKRCIYQSKKKVNVQFGMKM